MKGMGVRYFEGIKEGARNFLDGMNEGNYRYVKYTFSGDLKGSDFKWGLGNYVFAVKVLYMTKLLEELDEEGRRNLYEGIIGFTEGEEGYIIDRWITGESLGRRVIRRVMRGLGLKGVGYGGGSLEREKIWRAETRQAFCALFLLGRVPRYAFRGIPWSREGVEDYLEGLDWSHPWDAGSHLSHLLFFIWMNDFFFKGDMGYREDLIAYILGWLGGIRSGLDGCWYRGLPGLQEKINGAMKVLTGLRTIGVRDFGYVERLVDTCLMGVQDEHACDHFNIVYVLYCCFQVNRGYREREVKEFLVDRLRFYEGYYYEGLGGFSFYRGRSSDKYYGKRVSYGRGEPDLHGTVLFMGGLSMIDEILGLGFGLEVSIS